jgi:hypothetical protein
MAKLSEVEDEEDPLAAAAEPLLLEAATTVEVVMDEVRG